MSALAPSLFDDPSARWGPPIVARKPRAYQRDALAAWRACREQHRGVLFDLFTGAGKTYLAAEATRELMVEDKRTLFLCNRRVLGAQSLDELALGTGCAWQFEQAGNRASKGGRAPVVALWQTLQGKRLQEWPRDAFDQIIADEVHRLMGAEARKIFEHFDKAKLLGLSATPDAVKAWGNLFTHTAFRMDLTAATEHAWSVPLNFRFFDAEVDLSGIAWKKNKDGGDFDVGQLDEEIAKAAAAIRTTAFELCNGMRTLIRAPGVKSVITTTEALNDEQYGRPGCARMIYGDMKDAEKWENIRAHKAGEFPYLVSCMMIGEGYDDKYVTALLNAKPTTNRADAVQWWGRGSRLWSGIGEIEDEVERRAAIAASPKPECLVVELNAECRHELASPVTLFGGAFTEAEKKAAKAALAKWGGDPLRALQAAREEIARREARKKAASEARVQLREAKEAAIRATERHTSAGELALTPGQERKMREFGIPFDNTTTKAHATNLLRKEFFAKKMGWCTYGTREALERLVGVRSAWGMPVDTAKRLRNVWAAGGKLPLSPEAIRAVTGKFS